MKILVIGGGISPERSVSLKSASAIQDALTKANYVTTFYDWDGTDDWLNSNVRLHDIVFPILHGVGGEDGEIQQILEKLDARYLGSDSDSSANCINKDLTRKILAAIGIEVPAGEVVDLADYKQHQLCDGPHVLKPVSGGSSIDTFIIQDPSKRDMAAIESSFSNGYSYLIEKYIQGIEVTVSILGEEALPVVEIIPPANEVFDFANKYNGKTQELCPPINISKHDQNTVQEIALKVHHAMSCRHLSRVDMIVDNNGVSVLEINTMPGMTENSLYPKAGKVAGHSLTDLVHRFVNLVGK